MQKTNESGRSMVEMLGVLAIIGVLSVGGVAGFNLAMNKHCANNTVVYVNQLAVQGTSQMLMGVKPSLGQYPDKTSSGYPSALTTEETNPNAFYVKISQVPSAVCKQILGLQKGWQTVNDIGFYNGTTTCDDKENVDMWFEIKSSLNKENENVHCKSHQDCKNRFGSNFACNDRGTCELSCPSGQVQTVVGCCAENKVFNGGCCRGTITEENGVKKCCFGDSCCGEGEFIHNNTCWSCDSENSSYTTNNTNRCAVCPERVKDTKWGCSTQCSDPNAKLMYGVCHCPPDRPIVSEKRASGQTKKCLACNSEITGGWELTYQVEQANFQIHQTARYCNRHNGGGYSYYCPKGKVGVSWNDTVRRKVDGEWIDFRMEKSYGECISCEELDISALKYQAQCESCGGHWDGENWYTGICVPKETD